MTQPLPEGVVIPVRDLAIVHAPRVWEYAAARSGEIERHFAGVVARAPETWNGRVLMTVAHGIADGVFHGECFETDFASFIYWRDRGFADTGVFSCFGMAALHSADGAYLLGEMGAHTLNAGRCYFPSGSLDPADLRDGAVDLEGSVRRELAEETGLAFSELEAEPGWSLVRHGQRIALIKRLRARDSADALRGRIGAFLASEALPELSAMRVVRSSAEIDDQISDDTQTFLRHVFARER